MNDVIIWWQHLPEKMSPVIFEIGEFKLQYYGLMYIIAFAVTYALIPHRGYRRRAPGICAVLQFVILSELSP